MRRSGRDRSRQLARWRASWECLEQRQLLAAAPLLNEFLASNAGGLLDGDGQSSDWIEIRNAGDMPLDLAGYHLTDRADNPTAWTFPSVQIEAGGYLVVFASGQSQADYIDAGGNLHTDFALQAEGEYLALTAPDGSLLTEFGTAGADYPPQFSDVSFGLGNDLVSSGFFTLPTPGGPNVGSPLADPNRRVVIQEILYHPASQENRDEFLELANLGSSAVDLTGWRLSNGVDFTFPEVTLPAGGYLVVAADATHFASQHPGLSNVVGNWSGQLSNSSESVELVDANGFRIDAVTYADSGDWAVRGPGPLDVNARGWVWLDTHDGGGSSLELVSAELPNEYGQNWQASAALGGSPGAANSVVATDAAPLILETEHSPSIPGANDPVTVTARIVDEAVIDVTATLHWRVDGDASFTAVSMVDNGLGPDAVQGDGTYTATIPPQVDGTVVEFYVRAEDATALSRTWPAPAALAGQVVNALYQVDDSFDPQAAWVPGSPLEYRQIMTAAERGEFTRADRFSNAQFNATFIAVTGTGIDVRYNTGVRYRGSGSRGHNPPNNRINFPADHAWQGSTALNINADTIADQIAGSALFRLAGLPAAEAKPVRMFSNGVNLYGNELYAHVEPLNSDFAGNQFPLDSSGNLYKGRRPDESPPGGRGAGLAYHTLPDGTVDEAGFLSYVKLTNASVADWSDVIESTLR